MRNSLMLGVILVLAACSARFNQTNYDRMVRLVVLSSDPKTSCKDRSSMQHTVQELRSNVVYALADSNGRGDVDVAIMLSSIQDEVMRFNERLVSGNPSVIYCTEKLNNIHDTAELTAKSEGKKFLP